MVARGDLGVEIGVGRRAAGAEADHPRRPQRRQDGDHGHADAGVDDPPARADPGRGVGRGERRARRHVGADAVGRDGGRPLPAGGGGDDGADRPGGGAVAAPTTTPQLRRDSEMATILSHAACDIAEELGAPVIAVPTQSGVDRPPGVPVPAAAADRRRQPLPARAAAAGAGLGGGADRDRRRRARSRQLWELVADAIRDSGLAATGDRVVLTGGTQLNLPGATDHILVRTHRVGDPALRRRRGPVVGQTCSIAPPGPSVPRRRGGVACCCRWRPSTSARCRSTCGAARGARTRTPNWPGLQQRHDALVPGARRRCDTKPRIDRCWPANAAGSSPASGPLVIEGHARLGRRASAAEQRCAERIDDLAVIERQLGRRAAGPWRGRGALSLRCARGVRQDAYLPAASRSRPPTT